MRGAHHILGAHFQPKPYRNRIQRHRQRLGQGHRAEIFMAVVLGFPALDVERRILPDRLGRQAGFDRGEIDEGLEGRARLALGGHRAVVLAFGIVAAADHGAHRAIRCHRDQRALADIESHALRRKLVDHGGFGDRLQFRID